MIEMQPGFKAKLDGAVDPNKTISVELAVDGNAQYDYSCFGLDGKDKNPDERYFVFFGQDSSPANEITFSQNGSMAVFHVDLFRIPPSIEKLHFTVNIDGKGSMRDIKSCKVEIKQNGSVAFRLNLRGSNFQNQRAIIVAQIYKKDVWRIGAIGNGFNGDLSDLLKHYGMEEETDEGNRRPHPSNIPSVPAANPSAPHRGTESSVPPQRPASPSPVSERIKDMNGKAFEISPDDWV
ncbi:MAG: TerD family protein [Treponema sp.]|jgi:stress response protein SCP2|nr:TerD family protein [Treponema sp.]